MGYAFISVLQKYVLEHGGKYFDRFPPVKGCHSVRAEGRNGQTIIVNADAVVLASEYGANKDATKIQYLLTEIADDIATLQYTSCNRSMVALGQSVGADLVGMGWGQ